MERCCGDHWLGEFRAGLQRPRGQLQAAVLLGGLAQAGGGGVRSLRVPQSDGHRLLQRTLCWCTVRYKEMRWCIVRYKDAQ